MVRISRLVPDIPAETYQAARTVFNIEHIYLLIGDRLSDILAEIDLALLDPTASLSSALAVRLALVNAFQYAEYLPDAFAADALLKRTDWKYALHLPLQHPGITGPALCQYRQNLFSSSKSLQTFQRLLENLGQLGLFPRQALDMLASEEVLLSVCTITRFYWLNEAMKAALSMLGSRDPEWLRANALPHWYTRYQTGRLGSSGNQILNAAQDRAATAGTDIHYLLTRLQQPDCWALRSQPEIEHLARVWDEQFILKDGSQVWRTPCCAGCASVPNGYTV